ncbi:hypothetical protein ACFQ73_09375 [Amycolatopsis japonica]|uniref:hypothetical protein n=1 Tax=Amycolatopsis japonica TaxID=208439 RepID=UPI00366B7E67
MVRSAITLARLDDVPLGAGDAVIAARTPGLFVDGLRMSSRVLSIPYSDAARTEDLPYRGSLAFDFDIAPAQLTTHMTDTIQDAARLHPPR